MNYEQDAVDFKLNDNRVTENSIESKIAHEDYWVHESSLTTLCMLTLVNGFVVHGMAACADKNNFRGELGQKYAREDAISKIWPLEGYLLKQKLFEQGV